MEAVELQKAFEQYVLKIWLDDAGKRQEKVFMGYSGWLKPSGWHGGIPPISLVAFAFFVAGYTINLLGRK